MILTSKRTLTRSSAKVKIKEHPFLNIIKVSPGNLEVRIFNLVTSVQFNEEKTIYFFASVRTRNNCLFIVGKSLRWELLRLWLSLGIRFLLFIYLFIFYL